MNESIIAHHEKAKKKFHLKTYLDKRHKDKIYTLSEVFLTVFKKIYKRKYFNKEDQLVALAN